MSGMFRGIGSRLMGALSVTGRFKTHEAQRISDALVAVEERQRAEAPVAPAPVVPDYKPNRAERSADRRRNRFRVSRNKAFLGKRAGAAAQPRLSHEQAANSAFQFIYNPLLQRMLWSSGAMDAKHEFRAETVQEQSRHAYF